MHAVRSLFLSLSVIGAAVAQEQPGPGAAGLQLRLNNRSQMESFCSRRGYTMPPGDAELFAIVEDFYPGNYAAAAGVQKDDIVFKKSGVVIDSMKSWGKASETPPRAGQMLEYWLRRPVRGSKATRWQSMKVEFEAMSKAALLESAAAEREQLAVEKEKQGPLPIIEIGIGKNVIGIPVVALKITNNADQSIMAASFDMECRNGFGDPVVWPGKGNVHSVIYQTEIPANGTVAIETTLNLHQTTHEVVAWVARVKFVDGTEWNQLRVDADQNGRLAAIKGR